MIILETDRLIIRDHKESDLENHHLLISDPEQMTYIEDIKTNSLKESKENLDFSIKESNSNERKCYFFLVEIKETHEFVGSVGFTIMDQNNQGGHAEMGYFILKKHWGKGYTTEASKAVIDFAFQSLGLHKISAGCNAKNTASENIMKKLGMVKEAHFKSHVLHNGLFCDRLVYSLFKKTI